MLKSITRLKCGKFADKYVEFDSTVVFIDMLLHKPQVYRHLLINKLRGYSKVENARKQQMSNVLGQNDISLRAQIETIIFPLVLIKLSLLLILFEVYIKWAKLDAVVHPSNPQTAPAFIQRYLYLFIISFLGRFIIHIL